VTKDEHRLRLTAFENEAKIFTRSFQMLGAAGLVIFPFAGAFWASSLGVSPPILIGAFFGSFWCGYLLWAWMIKHLIAQFGLTCPLCTKHLTGPFGEFALMTGECLKCGSPIFDGDEPKPREAGALLSKEEFLLRRRAMIQDFLELARGFIVPLYLTCVFVLILLPFETLSNDDLHGIVTVSGVGLFTCIALIIRRLNRRYMLPCPSCYRLLYLQRAIASGKCRRCGNAVFAEAQSSASSS
jgi:hypothetical protein